MHKHNAQLYFFRIIRRKIGRGLEVKNQTTNRSHDEIVRANRTYTFIDFRMQTCREPSGRMSDRKELKQIMM